jgi:hypothetical protein
LSVTVDLPALPFIDEHQVRVDAPPLAVWSQVGRAVRERPEFLSRVLVCLLGAESRSASGNPLARGATLPGFTVTEAVPGARLVLSGRHNFSEYALIFTIVEQGPGAVLSARSHARFPGLHGRMYRALVIGTGAHRILLTRLLRGVKRAAEADVS